MPRMPLLALVAAAALILGAAPAFAAQPAAPVSAPHASTPATADDDPGDDWGEDPGDDLGDDPGDDFADDPGDDSGDDDACVEEWDDDAGEWVAVDGDCSDEDLCWEDDWSDDPGDDYGDDGSDDPTAVTASADDGSDDDWADDSCDDAADEPAPLVSKLRATPARHGRGLRVNVNFRLDRAGDVVLALERVGAQSSRRCAAPARAAGHGKAKPKAKNCSRSVALSGTMSVAGHAGKNATTLRRWKGRKLAPGSYRLTVTPDADGARSAKTTFKVAAQGARRR